MYYRWTSIMICDPQINIFSRYTVIYQRRGSRHRWCWGGRETPASWKSSSRRTRFHNLHIRSGFCINSSYKDVSSIQRTSEHTCARVVVLSWIELIYFKYNRLLRDMRQPVTLPVSVESPYWWCCLDQTSSNLQITSMQIWTRCISILKKNYCEFAGTKTQVMSLDGECSSVLIHYINTNIDNYAKYYTVVLHMW